MTTEQAIQAFKKDFDNVGLAIVQFMAQEVEAQGHKASGKLLASIENETQKLLDGMQTAISWLHYGVFVNSGVAASRIPFSNRSGAGASKFIQAIMNWVRFKGIAGGLDKDIKRATFAIARKMKEEGMPTEGSYKFTSNGRRLAWSDYVILTRRGYVESEVEDITEQYVTNLFWAKIEEIISKYTSVDIS